MYNYKSHWTDSEYSATAPAEWTQIIRELLIPGSVLDIGCGSARLTAIFEGHNYTGIDIPPRSITAAQCCYPDHTFEVADVVDYEPDEPFKNIFSWVSLQHINPEYFPDLAQKLTTWGHNFIFCEKTDGVDGEYIFTHPYDDYFDEVKRVSIAPGLFVRQLKVKT